MSGAATRGLGTNVGDFGICSGGAFSVPITAKAAKTAKPDPVESRPMDRRDFLKTAAAVPAAMTSAAQPCELVSW